MQKVIVVVGPTASGKTGLSIALARALGGEVVSADSRQVYRGLDIGTGKVTSEEMHGIPHFLIDVVSPEETFTASDFVKRGRAAIDGITARGRVPIIAGGTGFYVDALLGRIRLSEVPPNLALRERLKNLPLKRLLLKLARLDLQRATTVDQKNRVRLIRAIEIATVLGKVPELPSEHRYDALILGVSLPDAELKEKIHARLEARLKAGMLDEAKRLHRKGLSYKRMEELGLEYRYMARHLKGVLSYNEMRLELEKEIWKYAKRQKTWFKRNKDIRWCRPEEAEAIVKISQEFLKDY